MKRNKLISLINNLLKQGLSEHTRNLTYHERCQLLNSNAVLVARHCQYRAEIFFKEIIIDGPLKRIMKTKNYAIRVEFQVRGSPHAHCFFMGGVFYSINLNSENKNT